MKNCKKIGTYKLTLLLMATMLFVSCINNNHNSKKKIEINDSNSMDSINITTIFQKLEDKSSLSKNEYDYMFNYDYLGNQDAAENLGYLSYEYYYQNPKLNNELVAYLQSKERNKSDENINFLISIMYLDFSLNEYKDFNAIEKDFNFIKFDREGARKAYENLVKINEHNP